VIDVALDIGVAGWFAVDPAAEVVGALDELIYLATSGALRDAGLMVADLDGVSMASSDLNDGRAISTMTLTGATGSFQKNEIRVCNESLAALWVGAAEIAAGAARAMMVCAWSKFSDVPEPTAIPALAMEPTTHRALGYHPDAVLSLRRSAERGEIVVTKVPAEPVVASDAAVAVVLTSADHPPARRIRVTGVGAMTGPYLRPGEPVLGPVSSAGRAALTMSGLDSASVDKIYVGGMSRVDDDEIASALGIAPERLVRSGRYHDIGYAAGLYAVVDALRRGVDGPTLVACANGLGLESAHAIILEEVS
jgi:hypothetical protein